MYIYIYTYICIGLTLRANPSEGGSPLGIAKRASAPIRQRQSRRALRPAHK